MLVRKIVFSPVKAAIVFLLTAAAVILWSKRKSFPHLALLIVGRLLE